MLIFCKNQSDFVSLPWKLDNLYCNNVHYVSNECMTGGISYSRDNLNLKLYIVPPRHTDFEHITLRSLKYLLKMWFDHKKNCSLTQCSLWQYVRYFFFKLMVIYILSIYNLNDLTLHNHIENALHFKDSKWSQVYTLTIFCSQKYCQQFLNDSHSKLSSLSYYTVHTSLNVNLNAQNKVQFKTKIVFKIWTLKGRY